MIEIENELKANSTECIVKSVYDSYRSKTLNLVEESTKSFKTACEQIEQDIFVLVEENGLEEIMPVLDGFMEKFCYFVDLSGVTVNN